MCKKKKDVIRKYEVQFIQMCTKGEGQNYKTRAEGVRPLDKLFNEAQAAGLQAEIINATDDDGDKPLHIACEFGNASVVEWILSKPELGAEVNALNSNALTPIFLVCLKGYIGTDGVGSRTETVKMNRLQIVKMLVEKGANLNFKREKVELTPLHWAAYNDDAELVRYLLK